MKKTLLPLILLVTVIATSYFYKVSTSGQLRYLTNYIFTDYKQSIAKLGEKYDIKFITNIDSSFIDNSLIGENLKNEAKPIRDYELARYAVLLPELFSRYPDAIIKNDIKVIKLSSSLTLYGVGYGGANLNSILYLTSSGFDNGYTEAYIEELFHHELSSIFLRKHQFDSAKFTSYNPNGFKYAQSTNEILRAISEDTESKGNTALYKNGFLTKYSMSTLENDINMFAETIFTKPNHLRKLINEYPAINKKYLIVKQFYININPKFSSLFNNISN